MTNPRRDYIERLARRGLGLEPDAAPLTPRERELMSDWSAYHDHPGYTAELERAIQEERDRQA